MKVCHMTSAHESDDTRIFVKECCSLANAGHEVILIARGDSRIENGVKVIGVKNPDKNRFRRMIVFAKSIYKVALNQNCDVYHIHDPELLPYGIKLAKIGKKVIFDSHEDVPAQIMNKEWIPRVFRRAVALLYQKYETYAVKNFCAVITATEFIEKKFKKRAKVAYSIHNYPKMDDIHFHETPFEKREKIVCYVGGITKTRGEDEMKAVAYNMPDLEFVLAGPHEVENINNLHYVGKLNRLEVDNLYSKSRVGLLISEISPNALNSLPIKLFEYMAAGLPMVISDYPLWKKLFEGQGVGICVSPGNTKQVQQAIQRLIDNPDLCKEMAYIGRKLIEEKYNWTKEEQRLINLYKTINYK